MVDNEEFLDKKMFENVFFWVDDYKMNSLKFIYYMSQSNTNHTISGRMIMHQS